MLAACHWSTKQVQSMREIRQCPRETRVIGRARAKMKRRKRQANQIDVPAAKGSKTHVQKDEGGQRTEDRLGIIFNSWAISACSLHLPHGA